ncbi:hypothetical protein [Roseiconus lacunae]|uniref:Uncharacterized protein n=2 Tax=Roseiconus lacunae TaxID=2605694 RepID=A0ABT7PLZ4_9BACT|nr:hypothetical protein [Roseiconus lacunae]MDM4017306.1 hypothetical protein [Roseiconus lacunae]
MSETNNEPEGKGIWLTSDEVHELRDHIQALKVGHSLIAKPDQLAPDELGEIYRQMGEAISALASSPIFGATGPGKGNK